MLFGGIEDVTKELNDLWAFSFRTAEWIQFQEGDSSPRKKGEGPASTQKEVTSLQSLRKPSKLIKGVVTDTPGDKSIDSPVIRGNSSHKKRLSTAKKNKPGR